MGHAIYYIMFGCTIWITLLAVAYGASAEGSCSVPGCLKCNAVGHCLRCQNAIVHPTGECVSKCAGKVEWSRSNSKYEGIVCYEPSAYNINSMNDLMMVIAACSTGAICIFIVLLTVWYTKHRRKKPDPLPESVTVQIKEKKKPAEPDSRAVNQETTDPQRTAFIAQLMHLSSETPVFLEMLTETRKLSNMYADSDPQSKAYRTAVRDLLRILTLISRRENMITIPNDWQRLLSWGERVLTRYKRWKLTRVSFDGSPPTSHRDSSGFLSYYSSSSGTPSPESSAQSSPCLPSSRQHLGPAISAIHHLENLINQPAGTTAIRPPETSQDSDSFTAVPILTTVLECGEDNWEEQDEVTRL